MRKATITLNGMHCASCASNISKSLRKVSGVKKAEVNIMTKKGYLELEESVNVEDLRSAVSKVGNYKIIGIEYEDKKGDGHEMKHEEDEHSHAKPTGDAEIKGWKKKMMIAWPITIVIMFIMFSERLFGLMLFSGNGMTIASLILSFPVIFILGWNTLKGGLKGYTTFYFNMDSLISLGTIIAWITGILALSGYVQDFSGISSMIMTFFITGKFVEAKAKGQAGQ